MATVQFGAATQEVDLVNSDCPSRSSAGSPAVDHSRVVALESHKGFGGVAGTATAEQLPGTPSVAVSARRDVQTPGGLHPETRPASDPVEVERLHCIELRSSGQGNALCHACRALERADGLATLRGMPTPSGGASARLAKH